MPESVHSTAESVLRSLRETIAASAPPEADVFPAVDLGPRVPFKWPPHSMSADYHVPPASWTESATLMHDGEAFAVTIARTEYGVFGRCDEAWCDARGDGLGDMMEVLHDRCVVLFRHQRKIAEALGESGRFTGQISQLAPEKLIKLLYCSDRDVAHEARIKIETKASTGLYAPAMIEILRDQRHPYRRGAQWCVLDMLEDLPSFFPDEAAQGPAIDAIQHVILTGMDDYARVVFKAGVVLGGHICTEHAADALLACVSRAGKIGRRSAIHAVFHLAEWMPHRKDQIVDTLHRQAAEDHEPLLRTYAERMARDILAGDVDHVMEPAFEGED